MSTVFVESAKHDPRGVGINRPVNTVPLSYRVEQLTELQGGKSAYQTSVELALIQLLTRLKARRAAVAIMSFEAVRPGKRGESRASRCLA